MDVKEDEGNITRRVRQITSALQETDRSFLLKLVSFSSDEELLEIKETLNSNKWILPRVCQLGLTDVLQNVYDLSDIDINTPYAGKTGLQYACQEGHSIAVKWLLDHGATLKPNLWKEDSEFYLATSFGRQDVVKILITQRPDVGLDLSTRYCFLYAACLGGHLELVRQWLTPGMDVNETVAFTSDLNNCEHKYPLFAACQGDHLEVARFLIKECGATITTDICRHFPKFVTQLVRSLFLISHSKHQFEFYMVNYKLQCIQPDWFYTEENGPETAQSQTSRDTEDETEEEILYETVINVKENKLRELPVEVLWKLRDLVLLDASHNPLKSLSTVYNSQSQTVNRLKFLNLSHCQLESVSSNIFTLPNLENLNVSYNKLSQLGTDGDRSIPWRCVKLQVLDVSHNLLTSFPTDLQFCSELSSLNANSNQLTQFCTPWECPLKVLDLSSNKLQAFAASADQFWKLTLTRLYLQSNLITDLPESIFKMRGLVHLDASYNKIQRLPSPDVWSCPLIFLNLNDNLLGMDKHKTPLQRAISLNNTPTQPLHFPQACLGSSMMELFLANNDLKTVPIGISEMENLTVLDLSENSKINELPYELGKLRKLLKLSLIGIIVKDKELQNLISSLDNDSKNVYASDVISYLEHKRRRCLSPDILKIVVLGCKNKDGLCVVQKLGTNKDEVTTDHDNLTVTQIVPKKKKSLRYEIWEIPDKKVTSALLPCFLTLNSLYIIVHDAGNRRADLHKVSEKMFSVQACVLRPYFIVVCTYPALAPKSDIEKIEKEIQQSSQRGFCKTKFVSFLAGSKESVKCLQEEVFSTWQFMNDAAYERVVKLHQRLVPKLFLDVVTEVRKIQQDICRMDELLAVANCSQSDLDDGIDQNLKMHEFMLQVGAMLHYNIHMGELSKCVILNPAWLYKILFTFLKALTNQKKIKIAQLPVSQVRTIIEADLPPGEVDYFPAILKLLETFSIGIRMASSSRKTEETLLVPSLLPKQPPQSLQDTHTDACRAARLYCLTAISPTFWSHVISQLILAFDRFSSSKWKLGEHKSFFSAPLDRTKSFRRGCSVSLKGLNMSNKSIQYWRTGIMMHYDQGLVAVEQVECLASGQKAIPGVLVTVQTTGGRSQESSQSQLAENTKKLSVMGIIRDELEEVLELFNPKFHDPSEGQHKNIYALCPHCHHIPPGSGLVSLDNIHFTARDCAQVLLHKDVMICAKGPTLLAHLVPEFLFLEMPPELHLNPEDIDLENDKLGHGLAGAVYKGTYRGEEVAVKIFHGSNSESSREKEDDSLYPNVGDLFVQVPSVFSRQQQDNKETEQIKISNAFSEVRKEVGILSKLSHEFVVRFIGVCIRPQLLLVMELAPLGSLRSELEKKTRGIRSQIELETELSHLLFSRDLTYKIVLQIGKGLSYLHQNNIIYRDLKPDNILVFSLDPIDRVNIKLSDYGISKFVTLRGVTGLYGTVGYMAPEIVSKQPYTEKADMYSFGVVMLEVLTGLPPSEKIYKQTWFHSFDGEMMPSYLQNYKISTELPLLEKLMKECWRFNVQDRPTAADVVARMKADHFFFLSDSVWLWNISSGQLEVSCVYACEVGGRWNIWVCETGYSNHRCFSVYDVESRSFSIYRQECPGPKVALMLKIGAKIWLVCKDSNFLQVITRGTQNKFEISPGFSVASQATTMLLHSYGVSQEGESLVLLGHENGSISAYLWGVHHGLSQFTNMELDGSKPVSVLCSIGSRLIAASCGMTVYLLRVGPPHPARVDARLPELVNSGSVSLVNVITSYDPVAFMVAEGQSVWCCLEISSCLLKVDVRLKKVTSCVRLSHISSRDIVRLEEHDMKVEQAVVNLPSSKCKSQESTASAMSHRNCWSPGTSSQPEKGRDSTKPPVPPRVHPHFMRKGDGKPPPVPERVQRVGIRLRLTSLQLSEDTLVVGLSCGGLVILPLVYQHHSDESGSLPLLPFDVPVLRHEAKKVETRNPPPSPAAVISSNHDRITGSISTISLAGDKLVSCHTLRKSVLREGQTCRPVVGSKRYASLFSMDEKENFNNINQLEDTEAQNPGKTDTPTKRANYLNVDAARAAASGDESGQQLIQGQVADLAVWENISQLRLSAVRNYGHDSNNCCGWCCIGPALHHDETF